jgi:hypothetical protein
VLIIELSGIGAFARCLDFYKADESLIDDGRKIRASFQVSKRCLAYEMYRAHRQPADFCQVTQKNIEGPLQLIFGSAANCDVR